MSRPAPNWVDQLPTNRPIAEFSVWSADLLNIGADLQRIRPHADALHIDVADGHFAPAFLFFPDLMARVRAVSDLPIHVHLMIESSILAAQIDQFAEAGADLITLHAESTGLDEALARVKSHGCEAGLVLRVETPVETLRPYLDRIRFITLLGTAIGVKGKGLHEDALDRLRAVQAMLADTGKSGHIRVIADGGIRHETVPLLRAAGAEGVVLGSLAFGDADLAGRMAWLAKQ